MDSVWLIIFGGILFAYIWSLFSNIRDLPNAPGMTPWPVIGNLLTVIHNRNRLLEFWHDMVAKVRLIDFRLGPYVIVL